MYAEAPEGWLYQDWVTAQQQRVLNSVEIPPRRLQVTAGAEYHVEARLVWERDGAEWVATVAAGWTHANLIERLVLVNVNDTRCRFAAVWLPAADVRRIEPPAHRSGFAVPLQSPSD